MNEGKVILYRGAKGRSKTLNLVRCSHKYYMDGWKIFTNMKTMKFGIYLTNKEIVKKLLDPLDMDFFFCVLIIDEIQVLFDSRNYNSKENKGASYVFQQIRKRGVNLLTSTQFENSVEKRFLQHVDFLAFPEFFKPCFSKITYLDISSIESPSFIVAPIQPKFFVEYFDARPYFPLYNHRERQSLSH